MSAMSVRRRRLGRSITGCKTSDKQAGARPRPGYLDADCQLVYDEGRRQLHSATSRTCVVRRTYSNYGDRCFAVAGPKLWNSLPAELQQADISFQRFKRLLKTFLISCWDWDALWLTVKAAPHKFSYLLTYLTYTAISQHWRDYVRQNGNVCLSTTEFSLWRSSTGEGQPVHITMFTYNDALIELPHSVGSCLLDVINHVNQLFRRRHLSQGSLGNRLKLLTYPAHNPTSSLYQQE